MADPLVYIDTSTIAPGKLGAVKAALGDLVAFIEANEPQLVSYGAYIDDEGTSVRRKPASGGWTTTGESRP
jgi:hypothetical protein